MNQWYFSAETSSWYEAEGKAMGSGACLLGQGMAQAFISLVTLGKLLNLSGPYSTFASEIPLDKERAQSQITLAESWKGETLWKT